MTFESIAADYDRLTVGTVARWQRVQVWVWLDRFFIAPNHVLELGCGTGVDAVHLAQHGVAVHATDPAPTMVQTTLTKARELGLTQVTGQVLRAEDCGGLTQRFDGCFSNFAALNCVGDLPQLAQTLAGRLKPGAPLIIVVFGRYCLWELLGYGLRGRFSQAARRWGGPVAVAIAPGSYVETFYHTRQELVTSFAPWFEAVAQVGIGVAVPPIYSEGWVAPRVGWFQFAQTLDLALGAYWPYAAGGDHLLLVWRRR
ncbi:bifunctional 2-polyprenyl-6-hydroxyphenol methylase/3-demethylubiquinol 3-O-methyltransferase UbiG [Candidatus Cyanaurora vandensis]|uniref:class I SAM-dependent methyltransferase n=1 Tax=Candidatus Cyanaurora vandensis TaxID=2714958 RepID=UPI00257D1DF5|nr:class I SAM-dependent methyltransferase [Candidatus Cyanaurora vandensis]